MNEGIHLDLDTWIVPGQIRKANLCRGVRSEWPLNVVVTSYYYYLGRHSSLSSLEEEPASRGGL